MDSERGIPAVMRAVPTPKQAERMAPTGPDRFGLVMLALAVVVVAVPAVFIAFIPDIPTTHDMPGWHDMAVVFACIAAVPLLLISAIGAWIRVRKTLLVVAAALMTLPFVSAYAVGLMPWS